MVQPKNKSHWDKHSPAEVARSKLRRAVTRGVLVRPDACVLCGAEGPVFGHHFRGYAYPLDVWWVCISCNTRLKVHDGSQTKEEAARQMGSVKKTDNHDPRAKLALRRHFLAKYHAEDRANVLDCCQGSGVLWGQLREEFQLAGYWGLDVKPKKGRLKIDSVRILAQAGWSQNVIDIDTYGNPWKHWLAMLPNVVKPLTVFLTCGGGKASAFGQGSPMTKDELAALGLVFPTLKIPATFAHQLHRISTRYILAEAYRFGLTITEAIEAESSGNARYIGLRLSSR